MRGYAVILLVLGLLVGCTTPAPTGQTQTDSPLPVADNRGIDRLLLEAGRSTPPKSTELTLQAAQMAIDENDAELATRIISAVESPYFSDTTTKAYTLLQAQLALINEEPRLAIQVLEDRRFQNIRLDTNMQIQTGKLRAEAYALGRSYLASARELIYVDRLIPSQERQANHEKIFATLLNLDEATLVTQAEKSITSEIRGWLSLAAMTKRFQHDPLRQLNALRDWQRVWPSHPAAIEVPSSLKMLSRIVAERPNNIALLLPLDGPLANIGRAIRDGYIASHYQLTPDARLRIYDSSRGDILEVMSRANRDGAELIIGPLDRQKVTRIARQPLKTPVIALNRTASGEINPNLYQFGLAPEDESSQVADQVVREGRFNAIVLAPDTEWGSRNYDTFVDRFSAQGGLVVDSARFTDQRDYSELVKNILNVDSSETRATNLRRIIGERFEFSARRRQDIDFVFLLANANQARGINPTLAFFYAEDIPVYATSHIHVQTGSKIDAIDMNGIRFCDIPWKLSENDSTQQLVQTTWEGASKQLAPFYALGVDVHRLYPRLQQLKEFPDEQIFGATGILSLNEDNVINRKLMWAQIRDGEVKSIPMMF